MVSGKLPHRKLPHREFSPRKLPPMKVPPCENYPPEICPRENCPRIAKAKQRRMSPQSTFTIVFINTWCNIFSFLKLKVRNLTRNTIPWFMTSSLGEVEQVKVSLLSSSYKIDYTVSQEPFLQLPKTTNWFLIKWFLII